MQGKITLKVTIKYCHFVKKSLLQIVIKDTGIGMDERKLNTLRNLLKNPTSQKETYLNNTGICLGIIIS